MQIREDGRAESFLLKDADGRRHLFRGELEAGIGEGQSDLRVLVPADGGDDGGI